MSIVNIVKEPEYYYPAGMAEQDGLMTYQESQKLDNIPTPSNIVTKSSTAGLLKNDGTVDSNSYVKKSDLEEIKTASGNPITLTDAIAGNAIEVSAEIVAVQDLHGYDKPWVGGSGKNKAKPFSYSETASDVLYTYDGNGKVTLNGTANGGTATPTISVAVSNGFNFTLPAGTYTPSVSGPNNNLVIEVYNADTVTRLSNGNAFTIEEPTNIVVRACVINTYTYNNAAYYIQLELGTTATSYEPYENICPITGYSTVTITDVDSESHTATVTVSLGSTVYGGTLDLTSGELTITHASASGKVIGANDSYTNVTYGIIVKQSDSAEYGNYTLHDTISSMFEIGTNTSTGWDNADKIGKLYMQASGDRYWVGFPKGTSQATMESVTNDNQIVYELATPTTTTLTAAQLALVKGYNRLSCDGGGDITLTYLPDNALNELYKKVTEETDTKIGSLDASDVDALPDSVIIATEFSEETTYVKNKYVIYNGVIYRCTEYHAAGAWNASHFTPVSVCDELFDAGSFNKFYGNADYDGTTEYKVDHSYVHQGSSNIPDYPSDGKAGTTNRFGILKTMRIETGYIFQTLIVSYEGEPSGDDPTIKSKFYYRSAIRIDGTYVWGNWYETTGTEIV